MTLPEPSRTGLREALELEPIKALLKSIEVYPGSRWPNAYDVEGALLRDVRARHDQAVESPWAGGTLAAAKFIAASRINVAALIAEVERLRALPASVPAVLDRETWQDIETAPTDTEVLAHDEGAIFKAMKFADGSWLDLECGRDNAYVDPPPQHWMPLPAPPERISSMSDTPGAQLQQATFEQLDAYSIRTGCETELNRMADAELHRRGYVYNATEARWVRETDAERFRREHPHELAKAEAELAAEETAAPRLDRETPESPVGQAREGQTPPFDPNNPWNGWARGVSPTHAERTAEAAPPDDDNDAHLDIAYFAKLPPLELIRESAYCHHRHHLEQHSSDFSTCSHPICVNARVALRAASPSSALLEKLDAFIGWVKSCDSTALAGNSRVAMDAGLRQLGQFREFLEGDEYLIACVETAAQRRALLADGGKENA